MRKMSGRPSSSSGERSTTGIPLEGPPCSRTDEGGLREGTSDGDIDGGMDSYRYGDRVEAPLDEDEKVKREGENPRGKSEEVLDG
jgi:hypothetical protein